MGLQRVPPRQVQLAADLYLRQIPSLQQQCVLLITRTVAVLLGILRGNNITA